MVLSARAILAATKAVPGGARPTPAPQDAGAPYYGQISPLANQLATQDGYARSYGPFLPRPPQDFTAGAFGPFSPIMPVPVDQPPDGAQRAQPRRWQYDVGWNLPVGQPGTEGIKLASFETLKTLADLYSVARACIQLRKSEIRGLEWDIIPTEDASKAMQGDRKGSRDWGERRAEAVKFFRRPDPNYWSWNTWLDALLEEVFVFDALSLYLAPKRGRGMGKGLLGSDLDSLWLIDGPTCRPLVGLHGEVPQPPAPAIQQYLYGVPRSDLMAVITGQDLDDAGMSGAAVNEYRGDQLLYLPMTPRPYTPYGFPPVERALIPVMAGLQKQGYQLDYFREGTVPAVYISPGDSTMTPNQIRELQDALNAFAGDPAFHHKIIVLPPGSKVDPQRNAQLADQFDEVIMTQVCMAFDVMPMELGISPKVSATVSPGASNQMAKMAQSTGDRKATKPLLTFLCDIFNGILHRVCGQEDMRFTFEGLQEEEDVEQLTGLLVQQITNGLRSVDEARGELKLEPWGLPETSGPVMLTATGPVPFAAAVQQAEATAAAVIANPQPAAQPPAPDGGDAGGGDAGGAGDGDGEGGGQPPTTPKPPAGGPRGGQSPTPAHESAQAATGHTSGKPGTAPSRTGTSPTPDHHNPRAADADQGGTGKAARAELQALARHLRKGRAISTWTPRHLPAATLAGISEDLAKGLTAVQAVEVAEALLPPALLADAAKASPAPQVPPPPGQPVPPPPAGWPGAALDLALVEVYTPRIESALTAGAGKIRDAMRRLRPGKRLADAARTAAEDAAAAVRAALDKVLPDAWTEGWAWGQSSATAVLHGGPVDWGSWTPGDPAAARAVADARGLRDLLHRHGIPTIKAVAQTRMDELADAIAQAVAAGDSPETLAKQLPDILQVPSRAGMIAHTEIARAASAAALDQYKTAGRTAKRWNVSPDARVCPVCEGNEEQGAIPIDTDFQSGDPNPPAHPWCRCVVLPTRIKGSAAALDMAAAKGEKVPKASVGYRPADTGGRRCGTCTMFRGGTCTLVAGPIDAWDVCDEWEPPPGGPAAVKARRSVGLNGQEVWADDPPAGIPAAGGGGPQPAVHAGDGTQLYVPGGVPGATAGGEPPRWDGAQPHPRDVAAPDSTDDAAAPFTDRGRPPNAVGKAAPYPPLAQHVDADHVVNQMLANYPASALGWMRDARWVGPVQVPQDRIDYDDVDKWAAAHQGKHVRRFVKRLRADPHQVHPVVAVQEPGDGNVKVIDGHHRALAYRQLGRPVKAYVGVVDRNGGPWDQTHSSQRHSGADPANKAAGVAKVGPHGYEHGWIFVGVPGTGDRVFHGRHGHGLVTDHDDQHVAVRFDHGEHHTFEVHRRDGDSPGRLEPRPGQRRGESAIADAVTAGHRQPSQLTDAQLHEADRAMAERAHMLGKPGAVIPQHAAVRREMDRRAQPLRDKTDTQLSDDFVEAVERGDDQRISTIEQEMNFRDHNAWLAGDTGGALPGATHEDTDDDRRVDDLVSRGHSYLDAYAEVHGDDPERLRREQAAGLTGRAAGETTEQTLRRNYDEWVHMNLIAAEKATRGHLLSPAGRSSGANPADLFRGPIQVARRNASEELQRWWAEHGRLNYADWTAQIAGRGSGRQSALAGAARSNGQDFI